MGGRIGRRSTVLLSHVLSALTSVLDFFFTSLSKKDPVKKQGGGKVRARIWPFGLDLGGVLPTQVTLSVPPVMLCHLSGLSSS